MSAMDDWFARHMPDALKYFDDQAAAGRATPFTLNGTRSYEADPEAFAALHARKITSYINVPEELLMDHGLIPDTRPPHPPLPWRWRLRNHIADWREQAARRAYKIIAGYEACNGEDHY